MLVGKNSIKSVWMAVEKILKKTDKKTAVDDNVQTNNHWRSLAEKQMYKSL